LPFLFRFTKEKNWNKVMKNKKDEKIVKTKDKTKRQKQNKKIMNE